MSRRSAALAALCCALAILFSALPASAAPRTWAAGKYKVTGEFVSITKDKAGRDVVTIRQANGKEVEVPLLKLDPVDQAYAKKAAEDDASPFKEKKEEDSPFKPKEPAGEPKPAADTPTADEPMADAPPVQARTVEVDWNAAQVVDPQPEAEKWAGAVKPEQLAEGAPVLKPKTIRFPARKDHGFERAQEILFSPSGEKAAVGFASRQGQEATTRVVLLDLKAGKSLGSGETPGEYLTFGVENNGRRMLVRQTKLGFGENDQLEVWALGKSGIQKGVQWRPQPEEQQHRRDVKWGTIVADGKGLTMGSSGRLAMWNLETGQPFWYLDVPRDHEPAVSPNRKYLAYQAEEAIGLLDLAAGKVVALLPIEKLLLFGLAFSPDGKYLAGATFETLWVWDVATGELYREIDIGNLLSGRGVTWADPEHVLIGGSNLVHVESRIPVWQYMNSGNARADGGVVWFYVSAPGNAGEAVVGAELPHAAAQAALKQAMSDPNFFALKPGAAVALDVTGVPDADRGNVTAMLQKNLAAAGFKTANTAPVTVKASVNKGARDVSYRSFGSIGGQTYNVPEYKLGLVFAVGGKDVWKTSATHVAAPGFARLKEGQSMADLLKEYDKPGLEWFESVRLPKFVPRPMDKATLGSSLVGMQGVR